MHKVVHIILLFLLFEYWAQYAVVMGSTIDVTVKVITSIAALGIIIWMLLDQSTDFFKIVLLVSSVTVLVCTAMLLLFKYMLRRRETSFPPPLMLGLHHVRTMFFLLSIFVMVTFIESFAFVNNLDFKVYPLVVVLLVLAMLGMLYLFKALLYKSFSKFMHHSELLALLSIYSSVTDTKQACIRAAYFLVLAIGVVLLAFLLIRWTINIQQDLQLKQCIGPLLIVLMLVLWLLHFADLLPPMVQMMQHKLFTALVVAITFALFALQPKTMYRM